MRERLVLMLVVLTTVLVLAVSVGFALLQNGVPSGREGEGATTSSAPSGPDAAPDAGARGRAVFEARGCLRCHSVAGQGSPRLPLDGVGARRDRAALEAWTLGLPSVADQLPARARGSKEDYRALSPQELADLLDYLGSLR